MKNRNARDIWQTAKGALEIQVNRANYETWLKDTTGVGYEGNVFVVGTPSLFAAEWLQSRLYSLIQKTLISVIGADTQVRFEVCPQDNSSPARTETRSSGAGFRNSELVRLNSRYTFDRFVVGNSNRLAYAAALGVAESPARVYNPLFIYAGPGLGKTHLLHAIGHTAIAEGLPVIFSSAEQFTNEYVTSLQQRKVDGFRERYRSAGILLVDDIHFIGGKQQTEETFFHIFNDLYNANRQIVITSDRPPKSMPLLEDRLRSRFEWGLIADIQPPEMETRVAILRSKAEQLRLPIDDDVLGFIASEVKDNVRELEGTLNRVVAFSTMTRGPINRDLAEQALRDITSDKGASPRSIADRIVAEVSRFFDVKTEDIMGRQRQQKIVLARQVSMYLIREVTGQSLGDIGAFFGGRDHSTVLHTLQKIASEIKSNGDLRKNIDHIAQTVHKK